MILGKKLSFIDWRGRERLGIFLYYEPNQPAWWCVRMYRSGHDIGGLYGVHTTEITGIEE